MRGPGLRNAIWVCLLVAALAGVGWIYLQAQQARQMTDPARARRAGQPIPVRTVVAGEGSVEVVIGATAVTVPSEIADVRVGPSRELSANSPVSDITIKAVHIQEGDYVEQGQLLVELEDDLFRLILRQREAALATAEAEIKWIKEQVPLAQQLRDQAVISADAALAFRGEELENRRLTLEAVSKLQGNRSATSFEYYTARAHFAQARYDLKAAALLHQRFQNEAQVGRLTDQRDLARAWHNLEMARVNLEVARRDVERVQIKSPINGFVNRADLVPGTVINVNAVLVQVMRLEPMLLRLDFPQERLGDVFLGQEAEIVLDGIAQETFKGTVARIPPKISTDLRVCPVIVRMDNAAHRIKAGLSGFVRLRCVRKAVTVPAMAVMKQGPKAAVFCVEEGRARIREVQIGVVVGNGEQEIKRGLNGGDEVVIYQSNYYKHYGDLSRKEAYLQDQDLVDTDWKRWARRE
jgi:RND family efflux transporter MFP subunit